MSDEEPDWAKELTRKDGHPVLAMVIAVPLLLLTTCSRTGTAMSGGSDTIAYLLGGVFASFALFWGIPYLITIRHSSTGWKIGTAAIVSVFAVLSNLWAIGSANAAFQGDLSTAARQMQEISEGKRTALEVGQEAGPLGRIMTDVANRNIADVRAFAAALESSGAEKIAMLQGLTTDSAELRDCGRFDALRKQAEAGRGKLASNLEGARTKLQAEVTAGKLPQSAVDGFMQGAAESRPGAERSWELMADQADTVGRICTVLARKNWRPERGQVAFTSSADMTATNQQLARLTEIGAEQERLRSSAQAAMNAKAKATGL